MGVHYKPALLSSEHSELRRIEKKRVYAILQKALTNFNIAIKMHKRFSKNARQAIEQVKNKTKQKNLKTIDAFFLVEEIRQKRGCFGRMIIQSLEDNKEVTFSKNKLTASEMIHQATKITLATTSNYIGTEHLVWGYLSHPKNEKSILKNSRMKMKQDVPMDDIFDIEKGSGQSSGEMFGEIHSMIDNFFSAPHLKGNEKKSGLGSYSTDLSQQPQDFILVGRKKELERISHVLGRKMKNNPVLVGDPGVGKTAIVEGLAQKIKQGKAPYYLNGKKILSLDLGLLVAGTTFRGEFEARLKEVITEAKKDKNVILFIDEIHNLVGAGNAVGGMDAANLLKPALSRGEIQVIGATTHEEYHKHIEKDAALERRFQPIQIDEPTIDETVKILEGIKPYYEQYHNVTIEKEASSVAASLAKRYVFDRFLPDSAIDLIDETAARLRSQVSDNQLYYEFKEAEKEYDRIIQRKEEMVMSDRYEEAIQARQQEKTLGDKMDALKKKLHNFERVHPITVAEKDIQGTLSSMANIPEELLSQKDRAIANNVDAVLKESLIGQNHVRKEISKTVIRQISGISNPNRPLGSFLFIGPTGVGKTMSAKLLADAISPQKQSSLIQLNMSEFGEKHTISRLLGAPAGYVGYEESGELTDKIRKNPYSVVLFDEIEKAESSVLNVLLQILEDGELVDSKGRLINFRNTVVILTSNIGTQELDQISQLGFEAGPRKAKIAKEEVEDVISQQLKEYLAPELINRLDNTLIFNSLTKKDIEKIVVQELNKLEDRLKEKNIKLAIHVPVVKNLSEQSLDPKQGARLVRKSIQDQVEPEIAKKLLGRKKVDSIKLKLEKDKVVAH